MFIKRLELRNFKRFSDRAVALRDGVNLLAGGNDSGKSSILQALAIWQFCFTVLEMERGPASLLAGAANQGVGISDDEFTPVGVPSLRHLWTNLKTQRVAQDGYTLSIGARWDDATGVEQHLLFGLSLVNDRLFVKTLSSSLQENERAPRVAYLPPFSGITSREPRMSPATRRRLTGQGLSGGVIRNVILDMYEANQAKRLKLRENRTKIKQSDLDALRKEDPWEVLSAELARLFSKGLDVTPFNDLYHTYIRVECFKGQTRKSRFQKLTGYTPRDLMVEGSGFLQWLSVLALALNPDVDVLLLDEPDAHLHCSLQQDMLDSLSRIAREHSKQVLLATHSTEMIKTASPESILRVSSGGVDRLSQEVQKVGLLAGLGTEYAPRFSRLQMTRRMLLVENQVDERLLRAWAGVLGIQWPEALVVWLWPAGHKERKHLFIQLATEIPDLQAISLRDRDDEPQGSTRQALDDGSHGRPPEGFTPLKWRRRHIENYLLQQNALARAAGVDVATIEAHFRDSYALALPQDAAGADPPAAILDAHGKEIFTQGDRCLGTRFGVERVAVAEGMLPEEVAADVRTFLERLQAMVHA